MAYRPITDIWIMARPKVSYYGAFPAGFVERARALLGVTIMDPVLHVCGGRVRDYPYIKRAVGPNDRTVDLDPALEPDYLLDVRTLGVGKDDVFPGVPGDDGEGNLRTLWSAALVDRPYTPEDATHYAPGADALPDPNDLLKRALSVVRPGGRVGFLDYYIPRPPKKVGEHEVKFVACIGVMVGFGNRIRAFTVFERVAENALAVRDEPDEGANVPEPEPEAPLVEPTPEQHALVHQVVNEAEARKRLCRVCWGERNYPLPGADVQPSDEAKCDGCGHRATLMPVSLLTEMRDAPRMSELEPESLTVPEPEPASDPSLDGF